MEIRIIGHNLKIFEEGSQSEMVALPLAKYDVIELFYLREIYQSLVDSHISAETAAELFDSVEQINDVLSAKLSAAGLGLVGGGLDAVL